MRRVHRAKRPSDAHRIGVEQRTVLYNSLEQLDTRQDATRIIKGLKAEHGNHPEFYSPVVLLHYIIKYLQLRIFTGFSQRKLSSLRMPVRRSAAWLGSKPSRVIVRGSPWCFSALRKNAFAAGFG